MKLPFIHRLTLPLLSFTALLMLAAPLGHSAPKAIPTASVRPARESPFYRVPMAESSRSIVVSLATNLHVAFDAQALRTHTAWTGPPLRLLGPPYSGSKTPFLCFHEGTTLWTAPPFCPWSIRPPSTNSEPTLGHFRGISTRGGVVMMVYELTAGNGKEVRVHESFRRGLSGESNAVVRRIEVAPCEQDLWFLAHAEMGRVASPAPDPSAVAVEREQDVLLAVISDEAGANWTTAQPAVAYPVVLNTEKNGESFTRTNQVNGRQARAWLHLPAHREEVTVEITSVVLPHSGSVQECVRALRALPVTRPRMEKDSVSSRPPVVTADRSFTRPLDGDEFYRIEHFPLPREIDLLVCGMDWRTNGDLAVCTWPGQVWVVRQPQGSVGDATYQRFASGLNEPLGLKVVNDEIYVVQKCELTRLTDTDGNGEADLYECVTDGWHYSGNYHAFAFGPVIDEQQNFYVALCGQRGRWDMPYVGWCVKISRDGRRLAGFCHGLRAPNGLGTFGPEQDLFATDNEGNWVGACKLNHLRPGHFYGYPSGTPAPPAEYDQPQRFQPPAVWFPRSLAPSASGLATISDARFGPFQGQMLVGDFQKGVVLRVALEKVNGEWQGAVWPFLKGFLGAVNRLSLGPDGKLYVGGCRRAWPTPAPQEYSLDRVSFTGRVPFEVKEVRAMIDGLELTFTEPVDFAVAQDTASYAVSQFTYKYHSVYGSPEIDYESRPNRSTAVTVAQADVSVDRLKVRLRLESWRAGYVTAVRAMNVKSTKGDPLWHDTFYYTLNQKPQTQR